ncbi:MBL fold metallo-hydrolase [Jeotgalibacillus sp. R-1-5s-1]|uniref:MBL fold metallo-hydrolase n=1 Tax=Jeotgalibacillus sp. R-1-5s-1 TaxID=2555897 RepID=UPI00106C6E76|nr:MBL fold metallo-hydrolase [Jeotgalibacillus sp. R-1-5s-1]TFD94353.1 MBL fold metallo-hydrolase [Jeotgalibacillus sp. R-1-5s-1]
MINDPWFTVQQIDSRTFAISEYGHWEKVHSFLLLGVERAMLIDSGLGIDNIKRITDQLTPLPVEVFTTHVHVDHIGSHGEFDKVYVHERDREWLENGISGLPITQIRKDIGRDITKPTPKSFHPSTYQPFQGKPSGLLEDQQRIPLGNRVITVLHTPGHSPGHVCFFDETNGYLFTGDLLYDTTPIYAFYPSTSPEDLIASLEKITMINGVNSIFGSHHTLGLPISILEEIKLAITHLRKNNLVKFGTGIHKFQGFSIQF